MTALNATSWGAIHEVSVSELPSQNGIGVTAKPIRKALVFLNVDTISTTDTLDINGYIPGTVKRIDGILSEAIDGSRDSAHRGSTTWSTTTLTFGAHDKGGGAGDGGTVNQKMVLLAQLR